MNSQTPALKVSPLLGAVSPSSSLSIARALDGINSPQSLAKSTKEGITLSFTNSSITESPKVFSTDNNSRVSPLSKATAPSLTFQAKQNPHQGQLISPKNIHAELGVLQQMAKRKEIETANQQPTKKTTTGCGPGGCIIS